MRDGGSLVGIGYRRNRYGVGPGGTGSRRRSGLAVRRTSMVDDASADKRLAEEMEKGYLACAEINLKDAEFFLPAQAEVVLADENNS